jgi:hypothetical protein
MGQAGARGGALANHQLGGLMNGLGGLGGAGAGQTVANRCDPVQDQFVGLSPLTTAPPWTHCSCLASKLSQCPAFLVPC